MWPLLPLLAPLLACQGSTTTITPDEPGASRSQGAMLVFYDVRDLATSFLFEFAAPELGLALEPAREQRAIAARLDYEEEQGEPQDPVGPQATPEQIERGGLALEQVVRTFIDPPLSPPLEQVRSTKNATLVANVAPRKQAWIESFLKGLRRFDGLVEMQARIYTVPRGVLREWGYAPSGTLATAEELAAFQQRMQSDDRIEIVNAPKLMQFPCQRANISVVNQVAYVKSWQVQLVEPGGQEIADPEVAVIQEGTVVDARSSPLPGGSFGLQLELTRCELERPIPTRKVRISASTDQEVEIGEPEVKTARFAATVVLADGASAVLVTADTDPDKDLALVVTLRRVARIR